MVTSEGQPTTNLLDGSANSIHEAIQGDEVSMGDVAEWRRSEEIGQNRTNVIAVLDQRIGQLAAAIPASDGFEVTVGDPDPRFTETQAESPAYQTTTADARDEHSITPEMLMVAEAEGSVEDTTPLVEALGTEGREESHLIEGGSITHKRAKMMRMYRMSVTGWIPCLIPGPNVKMKLREGFRSACPDCGSPVCRADGNPNGCVAQKDVPMARCPVCRKKYYDLPRTQRVVDSGENDETELDMGFGANVTPRDRLMIRIGGHVRGVHPQEGEIWGFGAQSPKDPEAGRPRERELDRSAV